MNGLWRYYLSIALMDLTSNIIRFIAPKWATDLRADDWAVGLVGMAQPLTYIVSCLVFGRWSDQVGRAWMPKLGAGLYVLICLLFPLAGGAGSVWGLGLLNALVGVGLGLFWPVVEAYLAEQVERGGLVRALGGFNLAWSVGTVAGPIAGGWLYVHRGPPAAFQLAAFSVALVVLCWWRLPALRAVPVSAHPFPEHDPRFTVVGRAINFLHWLLLSAIITLYPLLAQEVGFDADRMGLLQGIMHAARGLLFVLLLTWTGWAYRWPPIWLACGLGVAGCGLIGATSTFSGHLLGFASMGLFGGLAYYSSLLYSLNRPDRRGEGGGDHEAVLASGGVLGPGLGGILSQGLGPRAPYFAGSALLAGLTIALAILRRRWRRPG